jgi:hypothetical protein
LGGRDPDDNFQVDWGINMRPYSKNN